MKTAPSAECLFSIEQECQTTFDAARGHLDPTLRAFFDAMRRLAPALSGPAGIFNGYGRVYLDTHTHVEFAFCECDDPYRLAQVIETQYELARRATAALAERGIRMLLVNNNHCGLLRRATAFWGTHENYLIGKPARELTGLALPFLVTRTFGGAGGVLAPTGQFLAGVRHLAMELPAGGGSTGQRAIFSTLRQEHHVGPKDRRQRLHLLVGDGHRSQFNTALQSGATALALRAMEHDRPLAGEVARVRIRDEDEDWLQAMQRLCILAEPGAPPRVPPVAIEVQRIYLEAARRTVHAMTDPPRWMHFTLSDWSATLDAYEAQDRAWLGRRLDAFIKHELFSHYLVERGHSWADVADNVELLSELTLLDHDYHSISTTTSAFAELERRGLIDHRVERRVVPGREKEPFVPDVRTRARARARFIREHGGEGRSDLEMWWEHVRDRSTGVTRTLHDPFAAEYEVVEPGPSAGGAGSEASSRH